MSRARGDLQALRGKRIFITGGTGFFGKWLVGGLVYANAEMDLGLALNVLTRDESAFARRHPEVAQIDSLRLLRGDVRYLHGRELPPCDVMVHAATDTVAVATEAQESSRTDAILSGTAHLLAQAKRDNARLLNVSSGGVYGAAAAKPDGASEDDVPVPLTAYGRAKLKAETLCVESGADAVTARPFAFIGPHLPLDAHYAAGNFLRDARRGGPILVRGDGTARRSYLYAADLVVWLLAILVRGRRGKAYNVGSDVGLTTAELARMIAAAFDPALEVVIQSAQAPGPQNIYLPNIDRARGELALEVAIPLREAIGRTRDFLL